MTDWRDRLDELLDDLERQRDELRLKLGLGRMEAKEEWEGLESRLGDLRTRIRAAADEADDAAGEVSEAAERLGAEIRKGFERIRRRLL